MDTRYNMSQIKVDWSELKTFVDDRNLTTNFIELETYYVIIGVDGFLQLIAKVQKTDPANEDQTDFEDNYKDDGNITIYPTDTDYAPLYRLKITPSGWVYQLHAIEFATSTLNSIYNKDKDGNDLGFTTIKFYDNEGVELTDQEDIDTDCVKTVVNWEPTFDYDIIGGVVKQSSLPSDNVRVWIIGVPDIPAGSGGSKMFLTGGVNLKYMGLEDVKVDGRTPKRLSYNATYHTNKLQIVVKTDTPGTKHNISLLLDIFRI